MNSLLGKGGDFILVTTIYNPTKPIIHTAQRWADTWGGIYRERRKLSIARLHEVDPIVAVVMKDGIKAYKKGFPVPLFFHPGMAMIRIKRLMRGDNDVMVDVCSLQPGDSFLDCTLGFAGDSLVASYIVGNTGKVVGLESEPLIAAIVGEGLRTYPASTKIQEAMKRICVLQRNHLTFLRQCENNSFDIVYFDPMFFTPIENAEAISPLRPFANATSLSLETIEEAKRVARRRVVMKNHSESHDFAKLGFRLVPMKRERSFTYGIIQVGENGNEERKR